MLPVRRPLVAAGLTLLTAAIAAFVIRALLKFLDSSRHRPAGVTPHLWALLALRGEQQLQES